MARKMHEIFVRLVFIFGEKYVKLTTYH